jgi:hypothetical protein
MKNTAIVFGLCVVVGAFAFLGCGARPKHERIVVSGTVSFEGKPLAQGQIRFVPEKGSDLPSSGATIAAGKFRADSHGGVAVGSYKISIEAYRPLGSGPQSGRSALGAGGKNVEQFIPTKYNYKSELKIDVPSGSTEIVKNFELTD